MVRPRLAGRTPFMQTLPMTAEREDLLTELFGTDGVPSDLSGRLLRTGEVARLFQVSERTIVEWARRGRIRSRRTPGGHRLYPAAEVRRLLEETGTAPSPTASAQGATADPAAAPAFRGEVGGAG